MQHPAAKGIPLLEEYLFMAVAQRTQLQAIFLLSLEVVL
jgi:hypothetical protein